MREYVLYFAARPIALAVPGLARITYLTTDHLGTPILATAAEGASPASCHYDLDGNALVQENDGILFERYLLGYRGSELLLDAVDTGACTRCSAPAIEAYAASCLAILDVDDNGETDAFTDGILVRRQIAGYSGAALIDLAVAEDCVRCTSPEIEIYLAGLTPAAQIWSGGFEPFGKDFTNASASGILLRLPGQWVHEAWEDATLGAEVYYNVHRWYEHQTGRYTQPDPLGGLLVEKGLGTVVGAFLPTYDYARNRPTVDVDPMGLLPKPPVTGGPESCVYYDQVCTELGCEYHCKVAPKICKLGAVLNLLGDDRTVGCVRHCLQSEDHRLLQAPPCACQGCPAPREGCLAESCIISYHDGCFSRCGSNVPFIVPRLLFPGNGC